MTSRTPAEPEDAEEDAWDFYPCRVDDAPASIFLNFGYGPRAPVAGADTLYAVCVEMLARAAHGMGDDTERSTLGSVEDRIDAWSRERGLHYVGRLRNRGIWQMTFYGPSSREEELRRCAEETIGDARRSVRVISRPDPAWSYFQDFLWPSAERMRWIQDRRVVDALVAHGDALDRPRRVDHWIYFPSAAGRDEFLDGARELGFEVQTAEDDAEGERPFAAQVHRVDSVDLDAIHDVVTSLTELAERHGGDYDGWETSVEATGAAPSSPGPEVDST